MEKLGILKKVDLRKAWNHEAYDFTNWLAKEDNLTLLSDEIGINIDFNETKTEANVGKFNVDILAKEENTGRTIVIENQLETTNHDHLGKIITYASGYDAEIVIWIVKDIRDEHKQAIDWLNEHTDEKINFFAIKMELWQIGNSPFAPKFQVICKPNDWAKIIKKTGSEGKITETKLLQLEYWTAFKDFYQNINSKLKTHSPKPKHWLNVSIGCSDAHISLSINTIENILSCEIWIPDNKELYFKLEGLKTDIENELSEKLDWQPLETKKASRIRVVKEFYLNNPNEWQDSFIWLEEKANKFKKVFYKHIQEIKD